MKVILGTLAILMASNVAKAELKFNGPVSPSESARISCNESEIQPLLDRASALTKSSFSCQDKAKQMAAIDALDEKLSNYYPLCEGANHAVIGRASDSLESRLNTLLMSCD